MQYKTHREINISTVGTGLVECIDIDYNILVDVFGQPMKDVDGYKVDPEWKLKFEDGSIASIYNYKTGKSYSPSGSDVEHIRDWHLGGSVRGAEHVKEVLNQKYVNLNLK